MKKVESKKAASDSDEVSVLLILETFGTRKDCKSKTKGILRG